MPATLDRTLAAVWAGLLLATAVSVAVHEGLGGGALAVLLVIAAAFVKVWLVGRYFMELRHAPPLLRRAFDAYAVVVPVVLAAVLLA
jgi:hypothetical protein